MPDDRKHHRLGASKAHCWMQCPASVVLSAGVAGVHSAYAQEGTMAHRYAECMLKKEKAPDAPQDVKDSVAGYAEYCRALSGDYGLEGAEITLSFEPYIDGGYGTVDFFCVRDNRAHIVDLKYGEGVKVDVAYNPQFLLYGLGTLQLLRAVGFDAASVVTHVYQPRLDHVAKCEYPSDLLIAWADNVLRPAVQRVYDLEARVELFAYDFATYDFAPAEETCRWCAAKNSCPARAQDALERAGLKNIEAPTAWEAFDDRKIASMYLAAPAAKRYLNSFTEAVEARMIDHGEKIQGLTVVEGRASRTWCEKENVIFEAMAAAGIPTDAQSVKKPISMTAAEKLAGKENKKLLETAITQKPASLKVVAENSTAEEKQSLLEALS